MDKDTIFISPLRNLPDAIRQGISKIQKNPNSSVSESQSRELVRTLIFIAGAIMVVVVFAGSIKYAAVNHTRSVSASIDKKHVVMGLVRDVDLVGNSFTLDLSVTYDEAVKNTHITSWRIFLPPGTSLRQTDGSVTACFVVADVTGTLSDKKTVPCAVVVRPGSKLTVEYLILDIGRARMVARAVVGQI
ncbi:hypothetical protein A2154_01390 [Candidatus Gottesmanbacteria bacterium RBG_16_43_7]|uniref:Uncharacterized protein n=1 Tax=Candidatus Gottesmanbacteria bacterium RBG_16_43_7 TaxID=1798373 RepID=A0A1F5ZB52_9BACT|nr:MAG: hypothetical protein A2154_01390 [Candidatus Gottesmanbacteria bacterium RBG_16_43_7]